MDNTGLYCRTIFSLGTGLNFLTAISQQQQPPPCNKGFFYVDEAAQMYDRMESKRVFSFILFYISMFDPFVASPCIAFCSGVWRRVPLCYTRPTRLLIGI